jgi:hypothetical protein
VAEPKNPALPKLREWPMFVHPAGKRSHKRVADDGRAPPHISELILALVPGGPVEKLAWLREQKAAGKLDGDDPEEIAQADALLAMLVRMGGSKGEQEQKRHLDELLDESLKAIRCRWDTLRAPSRQVRQLTGRWPASRRER